MHDEDVFLLIFAIGAIVILATLFVTAGVS